RDFSQRSDVTMPRRARTRLSRLLAPAAALAVATTLVAGCTSNAEEDDSSAPSGNTGATSNNDDPGETVTIGWSGPEADHGWLAAVNDSAIAAAEQYSDIDLRVAEATNDPSLQISQVE